MTQLFSVSYPNDFPTLQDVIGMTYDIISSGRHHVIWTLSQPDELASDRISPRRLTVRMTSWRPDEIRSDAWCHPNDLAGVGISSRWVTVNSSYHPDDIRFQFMSSGWLNWGWYLIQMSHDNVILSSKWDTLAFLSHPDELANFDFSQHAVALQCFRRTLDSHSMKPMLRADEWLATQPTETLIRLLYLYPNCIYLYCSGLWLLCDDFCALVPPRELSEKNIYNPKQAISVTCFNYCWARP